MLKPLKGGFCYTHAMTAPKLGSDFAKLWTANAISTVGDGALLAAGPLLVTSRTTDPAFVAGAVFAQQVPWLIFSLITGAYADRLNRRRIIVIANVLRALAIGGLAIAILL